MPEEPEEGFELVLPFLTDDPAFTHGFACGMIYAAMRAGEGRIETYVHPETDEQLFLMASRLGYTAEINRLDEHWMYGTFVRK
jgi:hypothetical protein